MVSKGQSEGPAGVKLILKKSGTQDVVKETTSKIGGGYTFEKVLPGNYDVEASHPTWKFETVVIFFFDSFQSINQIDQIAVYCNR